MIVTAWRIVKARYAADAFSGEGARVEGGRWNSPGSPVVYTSQSAALAALELLVHLGRSAVLSTYVLVPCSFDERLVSRIDPGRLPANWRSYPAPVELQFLGDNWLRTALSAVLEVPSAVIEIDSNYLLNPRHRDFREIRIERPRPFQFDARLANASRSDSDR
ncbi:MAG TPA: RES family NAD+ phosphorylase [Vicinamibacterales bacterium]|nr:RES family NAD+ phosphorylase [Vicinamibacterales bacterium]